MKIDEERMMESLAQRQRLRGVCAACREIFFKQREYIHSTFDVGRSLVSFPIRLDARGQRRRI